ncbi:MAG: EipA family protein, partial [Alphaproteobacteria bacterium]
MTTRPIILILAAFALLSAMAVPAGAAEKDDSYSQNEILDKARGFFGETTKGLANAIQKAFEGQGRPNAIITGEEWSAALGIGVRYGKGQLNRKRYKGRQVFWQGPSIGWDIGGNASKVFVLIYNLNKTEDLFQRFPGGEGIVYVIGGFGVNYQQSGDIILAPIRTGVG